MEMKIGAHKGVGPYRRALEHFLVGADDRHPVDEVSITALGEAINTAVAVASHAVEQGWGTIVHVETDYIDVNEPTADSIHRCPHLKVKIERHVALKQAHAEEMANFKKDHAALHEAMAHADHIERAKCILAGALAYGSKAKAEILEFDSLLSDKYGDSMHPCQRLHSCVQKIKKLEGQRVLAGNIHTSSDPQVLLLMQCHWLEASDANHRYGNNLVEYFYEWKKSDTHESFFQWLDFGDGKDLTLDACPRGVLEGGMIKYLTTMEREQYRVTPKDGLLCFTQSGEPVHGEKIFVMGAHMHEFYMGTKVKLRFQHSSFLAGGCVGCAGSAILDAGEVVGFSGSSGHYRPKKEDFQLFVQSLREQGLSDKSLKFLSDTIEGPGFSLKVKPPKAL